MEVAEAVGAVEVVSVAEAMSSSRDDRTTKLIASIEPFFFFFVSTTVIISTIHIYIPSRHDFFHFSIIIYCQYNYDCILSFLFIRSS